MADNQNHSVIEHRYRTSRYFLDDQLRCSEAVQDYRSVKELLSSAPQFSLRSAFQFALDAVPVKD